MSATQQSITVLGSTGSIGVSTLDVIAQHRDRYRVFALTARTSVEALLAQCQQFEPRFAVMLEEQSAGELQARLRAVGLETEVLCGIDSLCQVAAAEEVDAVMAAIVGAAGLEPTLSAARAGKRVLLANKESLVMAGGLFMAAVRDNQAVLLPIDSEHNAIFQCMRADDHAHPEKHGFRKILLTASGGPFLDWSLQQMSKASPAEACAHPNWDMGQKISVDSATLMNKGLELIEACWLFDVDPTQVEVVVHPQSTIHSMVQYVDGSVLAELGNPDMRTPIAYGLAWPERISSGVPDLDIISTARLDFQAPDTERFPCLDLARKAAGLGGNAAAVLNAANEEAVDAFLGRRIGFCQIAEVVQKTLADCPWSEPASLDAVKAIDLQARDIAREHINTRDR